MAEIAEGSFATIIIVVVTILPFFTSNALEEIDKLDSTGLDGYLKFGSYLSIFYSYLVIILVATLVFIIWGSVKPGLLLTAIYIVFVAFYIPSLALLVPRVREFMELYQNPEYNNKALFGIFLFISLVLAALLRANPA